MVGLPNHLDFKLIRRQVGYQRQSPLNLMGAHMFFSHWLKNDIGRRTPCNFSSAAAVSGDGSRVTWTACECIVVVGMILSVLIVIR